MKNRKTIPLILYLVILAVVFTSISGIFSQTANTIPYSQVVSLFRQEQVQSFTVRGDTLTLKADYTGFTIPNEFVVGYGLDYNEHYRNLPYVGVLKPAVYEK